MLWDLEESESLLNRGDLEEPVLEAGIPSGVPGKWIFVSLALAIAVSTQC